MVQMHVECFRRGFGKLQATVLHCRRVRSKEDIMTPTEYYSPTEIADSLVQGAVACVYTCLRSVHVR